MLPKRVSHNPHGGWFGHDQLSAKCAIGPSILIERDDRVGLTSRNIGDV
jgi:hypothetical protein